MFWRIINGYSATPNAPIILTCRTDSRTVVLARHLVKQIGYAQAYNVRNGVSQWIGDNQPVTRL